MINYVHRLFSTSCCAWQVNGEDDTTSPVHATSYELLRLCFIVATWVYQQSTSKNISGARSLAKSFTGGLSFPARLEMRAIRDGLSSTAL